MPLRAAPTKRAPRKSRARRPSFCYWSVVDGDYSLMAETMIHTARQVGVSEEFHIWSERPVPGSVRHRSGAFDKTDYLFKLRFLQGHVRALPYDYFVWLDADNVFVRHPGDVLRVMQGSPVHASLESDVCDPRNAHRDWRGCPLPVYAHLMRSEGVKGRSIFNVNGGFWIVHRDAVDSFCELAFRFWRTGAAHDYVFTEEAPIAFATHMLCPDPARHQLRRWTDLWASDWRGHFARQLPDGRPWTFRDFFTLEPIPVNPAIVHAITSKEALLAHTRKLRSTTRGKAARSASKSQPRGTR